MDKTPFQKFIELIDFDQHIASLESQLKQVTQEIGTLESQEADQVRKLELLRRAVYDAQKAVDARELEMKALDAADQEKKERVKLVTDHKEYKSLKVEIERVHQKQHTLEQELLGAWKQLESAQKTYEEKTKEMQSQSAALQSSIQEKKLAIEKLKLSIQDQSSVRPAKQATIPAEWLEKYMMMRSQVQDPVVPVENGSCSACFYKVTENDMQQLRRNKLMQCKDCYRFLYMKTAHEPEEKS